MEKIIYAKAGSSEQIVDMRAISVHPSDMILMKSERPESGDWIACQDGTWKDNREETERQWAMSELARTDRCKTDDYPLNGLTREALLAKINDYREKLRNPQRSNHPAFPDQSWRPQWPEGVKRPAV